MNNHIRWYDKDEDLSQFLTFLEGIDERKRKVIAKEVLQIIFTELDLNPDEKILSLYSLEYSQKKRWYDEDIDVQSSIELIKDLSSEKKQELLSRTIETIQQLIFKGKFN